MCGDPERFRELVLALDEQRRSPHGLESGGAASACCAASSTRFAHRSGQARADSQERRASGLGNSRPRCCSSCSRPRRVARDKAVGSRRCEVASRMTDAHARRLRRATRVVANGGATDAPRRRHSRRSCRNRSASTGLLELARASVAQIAARPAEDFVDLWKNAAEHADVVHRRAVRV